jgi:hypothetical protein
LESTNGRAAWTDISGNLLDAPADDLWMTAIGQPALAGRRAAVWPAGRALT